MELNKMDIFIIILAIAIFAFMTFPFWVKLHDRIEKNCNDSG